jgi:hypothetical protein
MFNLELQWIQKCDVNQDTFYNGEEVICVKPNGQMFKLAYNEEKGCFVDRLGNEHDFNDFVEFCDMQVK